MHELGIAQRYQVVKRDSNAYEDIIHKILIPEDILSFMDNTKSVNNDTISYSVADEPVVTNYKTMSYRDLIKTAKEQGLFKVGMKRQDIINALNNG